MSMNMSLRFEVANRGGSLINSLKVEKERIMKDELMAERILQVTTEKNDNLKAGWAEGLEEASQTQRYRLNKEEIKHELSYANKAVVAVRRAALRELLEREHDMYEQELHKIGKAFYIKRT
uniref:uncharacterized protein C1orf189 homolog n=1 Tax=Ciona intestinalis TaxID=7719 RepID=UPI000180D071|nr:uncharacterized protein C1orf189 homolog [Ciona intestinalis]|eukprot:XP_026691177.1 uncharacterized protein C1orf189 homolog [Ciona intestinalis]